MDRSAAIAVVERFRDELASRGIRDANMILFGSHANGAATEDSDIDVVVLSEDFEGKGYWERIDILSDAIYTLFEPIEAVAMTPAEWESGQRMIVDIARDGVRV